MRSWLMVFFIVAAFSRVSLATEELTLTTYYPSPYGSYNALSVSDSIIVGDPAQPPQPGSAASIYVPFNVTGNTAITGTTNITGNIALNGPVVIGGDVTVNGNGTVTGTWVSASDARFKSDIQELSGVLDKIKGINSVAFNWRVDEFPQKGFSKNRQIGLIAQEVEKEFPELVYTDKNGYKSLDYNRFNAVLLEAVKEQQKQIEALKKEIDSLKNKIGR